MKILTWNINGIRATNRTSSLKLLLDSLDADIICLQETKVTRNLLTEDIANVDGYHSFFSFSRKKGGYSGVATFCKKALCPFAAEEGLTGVLLGKFTCGSNNTNVGHYDGSNNTNVGHYDVPLGFDEESLTSLDSEGRAVITEHQTTCNKRICVINVYCPRADVENEERYRYKMSFYRCLEDRCKALIRAGKDVVLVGDMNVSHKKLDHCDPDETFDENEARKWLNALLIDRENAKIHKNMNNDINMSSDLPLQVPNTLEEFNEDDSEDCTDEFQDGVLVDMFRIFHPFRKSAFTCWNTRVRARETNYGTRIDLILVSKDLASGSFTDCRIRPDVFGSDHCPVEADLNLNFIPSDIVPALCASFLPEVCGKQQKIKSYFSKKNMNVPGCGVSLSQDDCSSQEPSSSQEINNSVKEISEKKRKREDKTNLFSYFSKNSTGKKTRLDFEQHLPCEHKNIYLETSKPGDCVKFVKNRNQTNGCTLLETDRSKTIEMLPSKDRNKMKGAWKNILKGPGPVPLCSGHKEKTVLRTVRKEGPNLGRMFYVCNRPAGHASNKEATCGYFMWKT